MKTELPNSFVDLCRMYICQFTLCLSSHRFPNLERWECLTMIDYYKHYLRESTSMHVRYLFLSWIVPRKKTFAKLMFRLRHPISHCHSSIKISPLFQSHPKAMIHGLAATRVPSSGWETCLSGWRRRCKSSTLINFVLRDYGSQSCFQVHPIASYQATMHCAMSPCLFLPRSSPLPNMFTLLCLFEDLTVVKHLQTPCRQCPRFEGQPPRR